MLRPEIECGYSPRPEFNVGLRNDLKAVADSVADAVENLFGTSSPPAGARRIWCFYEANTVPMVVTHPTEYPVRLSVIDRDYCKLAFQLSHELAHIMMDPRHDNWIIEAIAVAVSLQILEDLARSWQTHAPYPNWSNFAPQFAIYRQNEIERELSTLDHSVIDVLNSRDWKSVTAFLKANRAFLDANPCDRPMITLCAVRLLSEPMFWPALVGLAAQTNPPPMAPAHFNGNIPLDMSKLAPDAMQMLERIGL